MAQSHLGKWISFADGRLAQIEFRDDSSFINIAYFEDVRQKKYKSRILRIPYNKVEKKKNKAFKYIVADPESQKPGIIQVFDISKDHMRLFVKERFEEGESPEDYTPPPHLGIRVYSWPETERILREGKDPKTMSRAQVLQLLENFKKKVVEITGGKIPTRPNYEQEIYLFNYYFDILVDMGYNIFENDERMDMGIDPYKEDPEVKKLMDEIEEMIEGRRGASSAAEEEE